MRVIAALILILHAWPAAAEVLTPQDAMARAAAGDLTIVDVRLPAEWAETGMPEGALGVSLQDPATGAMRPDFVAEVLRVLDRPDQPVALICARGNRSALAAALLVEAGFTQVHDISEGMIGGQYGPGWLARALPTTTCKAC